MLVETELAEATNRTKVKEIMKKCCIFALNSLTIYLNLYQLIDFRHGTFASYYF